MTDVMARIRPWLPGLLLALLVAAAFLAPLPHSPTRPDARAVLQAPSGEHWLGTDMFGIDVFSRLVRSAATDVPLALAGMLVSLAVGVPVGLLAAQPGRAGEWMIRVLDVFQAFPLLILAIATVGLLGNDLRNVVVAVVILNVPRFIRLVRAEGLVLREARYIEAAHAIGAGRGRVMFGHMLPNMTGTVLSQASLAVGNAIMVIAALSFLGIGLASSDPSWGAMIRAGAENMSTGQWWVAVFPGLAIFTVVLCCNALSAALSPERGVRA
ncbi:MAG: ABC transporter permease [Acidimicrobiia bacterium]